ncbi:MAG: hypothetical protein IH571_05075 [Acholeplasmataceae bacterium]|nr:hypothetical protein [Acholeplasmataceae bacterium]
MHQCKLLVNFETHYLFHKIPFDVLDFKPMVVQVKADYGYEMGKLMIKKLKNLDLLNEQGQFSLPKDDQYVMIEKKEETILRKHMNKGVNE